MPRSFALNPAATAGLLLACLLAGSGCRTARAPQSASSGADAIPRLNDAELEDRAQALAAFSAGVVEQARDDNAAALAHFVRSLEKDPGNEALALEVSRRFMAREQPQKAFEILERSVKLPGVSAQLRVMFGLACVQVGRIETALTTYRELIREEPTQLGHYAMLAQILLQQKQPAEALKVVETASRQKVVSTVAWLDLAALYGRIAQAESGLKESAIARARECLAKVSAAKPSDPALLRRLADGYLSLGDSGRAEAVLRGLVESGAADPQVTARLAELYLRSGRLDEARRQFQEMARSNPANPAPHYFLGIIALEQRDFPRAAGALERSLLLNPEFEAAYADLATAQMSEGKHREALGSLDKARSRFGPDFRGEFLAALCHANLKEFDQSRERFTSAEKIAREKAPQLLDHRFYLQLGSMLERAGHFDDAVMALEQSLMLDPDFDEALNHLGYMWAERGINLQIARDMIERAVKAEPENPAYLDSLGWVLFQLKKPAEALPPLQKAVELLKESDATVFDHLGDVLKALGRLPEAREAWQKSLAVEPSEAVKRKLEETP
jgi:tetratricopeptide (TPR) repeat protein